MFPYTSQILFSLHHVHQVIYLTLAQMKPPLDDTMKAARRQETLRRYADRYAPGFSPTDIS
jgi:hypothetical protein